MGDPVQEARGTDHPGTSDTKSGEKVVRGVILATPGRETPVLRRRDYIDNVFTRILWLPILHTYILEFQDGGRPRSVEVGADELGWRMEMLHPNQYTGWTATTRVVNPYEFYDDFLGAYYQAEKAKSQALKVDRAKAEATTYVAFYELPEAQGGLIAPTRYTRVSAPYLFWALNQLHGNKSILQARLDAYKEWGDDFRLGANTVVLNRLGLQMNEQGVIEPAIDPLDRFSKAPKSDKSKSEKESKPDKDPKSSAEKKALGVAKTSPITKRGPVGTVIMKIAGGDDKALAAAERLAERGHRELLRNIAQEFEKHPKEGTNLLTEIGKLKEDRQLDGLEALRRALGEGHLTRTYKGGKIELDWLDFFQNFKLPEKERNTILALVGEIYNVVDPVSLAKSVGMVLRANPSDIAGGLGVFHAAAGLSQKYSRFNPKMRLEERTITPSTRGDLLREVDIVVVIGQREIHHEVKTYDKVFISDGFERQIAKDLLRHHSDNFENQQYLFPPKLKGKLNPVRDAILEVFDKTTAPELQRQKMKPQDISDLRKRLVKRLKDDMVDSFNWFPVP